MIWVMVFSLSARASNQSYNVIDCLRELIEISDHGVFKNRKGFEQPVSLSREFLAFPEIRNNKLNGFYIYNRDAAFYYDAVEFPDGQRVAIKELAYKEEVGIYRMTAQPLGLETVSIDYLPGFDPDKNGRQYNSPALQPERVVKKWMFPEQKDAEIKHTLLRLLSQGSKTPEQLWAPVHEEKKMRRSWIQRHNLDQAAFRNLNRVLEGVCRE